MGDPEESLEGVPEDSLWDKQGIKGIMTLFGQASSTPGGAALGVCELGQRRVSRGRGWVGLADGVAAAGRVAGQQCSLGGLQVVQCLLQLYIS